MPGNFLLIAFFLMLLTMGMGLREQFILRLPAPSWKVYAVFGAAIVALIISLFLI